MSKASMDALRSIASDAGRERAKGGRRGRPLAPLTITIGEAEIEAPEMAHGVDVPEHMQPGHEARAAGRTAADGDVSQRASTAEAASVGAVFGDEDEDEEE